ncbi:MAG TPA: aminotransferase class V-fold PLP-dependent enzyme [Anaerolineaceae bacterium]|nr:aminotransferase class V-fold PLP-dependent enzyme [Anaerolineaceae bacterium]
MDIPHSTPSLRDDFLLDPSVIFLNHGSFGATPRPVFASYQRWQLELERQPVEFLGRRAHALLQQSREALAEYLRTDVDNLVYVTNATTGLNTIIRSLDLGPEDEVLTSQHEYGALDRTWRFLAQKKGFHYIHQPLPSPMTDHENFVDCFWQGVTPRTRVIFLSHITSPTALIFPVQKICQRARAAGILTVIDGAHAPGQVPVSLDEMGADFYSGNLHKWLCAPKGAAFLFARPECQRLVEPLVVSWGWESDTPGPSPFIDQQEWTGTRDLAAFLAVPDAIAYQQKHNWDARIADCHALLVDTQHRVARLTGLPLLHADSPEWTAQMAAAPLPNTVDLSVLKTRLYDDYRVEVPLVEWNGHKLVRISIQVYNNQADADALLRALSDLLGQLK